jgi:hypothetical protein
MTGMQTLLHKGVAVSHTFHTRTRWYPDFREVTAEIK